MVVRKGVVDAHVVEEPADVAVEEALHLGVAEARVDEDGAEVGFDHVRKAFGRILGGRPVVGGAVGFSLGFDQLGDVFVDEGESGGAVLTQVGVEAKLDTEGAEKFV